MKGLSFKNGLLSCMLVVTFICNGCSQYYKQPHAYLSREFVQSIRLLEENLKYEINDLTESLEVIHKAFHEDRKVIPYLVAEQAVIDFEALVNEHKEKITESLYDKIIKGCLNYKRALEEGRARISLEEQGDDFPTRHIKINCDLMLEDIQEDIIYKK